MTTLREIPSAPGYFASPNGDIYSGPKRTRRGIRKMKPRLLWTGYMAVSLRINGNNETKSVHRLVLEAFAGLGIGMVARHLDGSRTNNSISNLRWGTNAENIADRVRHGTNACGEKIANSKITADQALEIVRMRLDGESHVSIADALGVGIGIVSDVLTRKTWRSVTPESIEMINARGRLDLPPNVLDRNGNAKLTTDDVLEIRRRYRAEIPRPRQIDLASEYGVTQSQISAIVRGAQWNLPS